MSRALTVGLAVGALFLGFGLIDVSLSTFVLGRIDVGRMLLMREWCYYKTEQPIVRILQMLIGLSIPFAAMRVLMNDAWPVLSCAARGRRLLHHMCGILVLAAMVALIASVLLIIKPIEASVQRNATPENVAQLRDAYLMPLLLNVAIMAANIVKYRTSDEFAGKAAAVQDAGAAEVVKGSAKEAGSAGAHNGSGHGHHGKDAAKQSSKDKKKQ